jgi:hypothetical protein
VFGCNPGDFRDGHRYFMARSRKTRGEPSPDIGAGHIPLEQLQPRARRTLKESEGAFNAKGIGLSDFELGEPQEVLRVCPSFLRHFLFAATEPACLLLSDGALVAVRFGRATAEEILTWVLSKPTLPQTPELCKHPYPQLIGPSLTQALTDEETWVRAVAEELLPELHWSGVARA